MHIPGAWTIGLATQLSFLMTMRSIWRYRGHVLRHERGGCTAGDILELDLRQPYRCRVALRATDSDLGTFNEVFVSQVYRAAVRCVQGARSVIDLGSNIGLSALYFAAHLPKARIYCVEPGADTYAFMNQNVAELRAGSRLESLQGAVWDAECRLHADPAAAPYSNALTMRLAGPDQPGEFSGYPMAEIIRRSGFRRVDLLKADIEGAERQLFANDVSWLDAVGAIAIEFHGTSRADARFDHVVAAHGFSIVEDGAHTVVAARTAETSTEDCREPALIPRQLHPRSHSAYRLGDAVGLDPSIPRRTPQTPGETQSAR